MKNNLLQRIVANKNIQIAFSLFVIFVFSVVYVTIKTMHEIGPAEDPTFHNGSYLVNFFLTKPTFGQRGSLTEGYKSLVYPFGFISFLVEIVGGGAITHYRVQLLAHLLMMIIPLFCICKRFGSIFIATLVSLAVMGTDAFYEQLTYSIGASQIVLVTFAIWAVLAPSDTSRFKFSVIALVALSTSLSLWSNLPQLFATWFTLALIFSIWIVCVSINRRLFIKRLSMIFVIALVLYAPFIIWMYSERDLFIAARQSFSTSGFSNMGPSLVIQGFGKWFLADTNWKIPWAIDSLVWYRQLIRFGFLIVIAGPLVIMILQFLTDMSFRRSQTTSLGSFQLVLVGIMTTVFSSVFYFENSYSLKQKIAAVLLVSAFLFLVGRLDWRKYLIGRRASSRSSSVLSNLTQTINSDSVPSFLNLCVCMGFLSLLSMMGGWNWYWIMRDQISIFAMFREPWAKFSIPQVVVMYVLLAAVLSSILLNIPNRLSKSIFSIIVLVICSILLMPFFDPGTPQHLVDGKWEEYHNMTLADWNSFEAELNNVETLLPSDYFCIYNKGGNLGFQTLVHNRFMERSQIETLSSEPDEVLTLCRDVPNSAILLISNNLFSESSDLASFTSCARFRGKWILVITNQCLLS